MSLVVDADGHVLEPMSAWADVPERYRPQVRRDRFGLDHVVVDDVEIVTVNLGLLGTPGSRMSDVGSPLRYEDAQPGGFDPVVRLQDMGAEGIDAAVLYPSVGLNFWALQDPAAA
ncbi:MAG: hypothetical protein ACYDAQ_20510, partial [Mycobacteriales bacterium]